jgi:L-2-hydroxyglutarate oxidase
MKANMATGISEMKDSLFKGGYLERCRKYCPELTLDDLQPYPAGIRAQAVTRDGSLIHDFLFAETPRSILVLNAPSPAATSAMPIGEHIVDKVIDRFE